MTAAWDRLEAQALLSRLARGIEHRFNNLITVLLIASQQLPDLGDSDEERAELGEALDQTVEHLTVLQEVLSSHASRSKPGPAARATASLVSGLDHRITVEAVGDSDTLLLVPATVLARMLIAGSLVAQASLSSGGQVVLGSRDMDGGHQLEIRALADGGVLGPADLPEASGADLDLLTDMASEAEVSLTVQNDEKQLRLQLLFSSEQCARA